jgi:hypothetical protein
VEKRLFEFDNRLKNLETMLGLLESKLGSLPPEITNNYPELIRISINDINPEIVKITQIVNANNEQLQKIGNNVGNENGNGNTVQENNKGKFVDFYLLRNFLFLFYLLHIFLFFYFYLYFI